MTLISNECLYSILLLITGSTLFNFISLSRLKTGLDCMYTYFRKYLLILTFYLFLPYSCLNKAINHELYIFECENNDVIEAREWKTLCLLELARYSEAEEEAKKILDFRFYSGLHRGFYLYAESLYFQCKVLHVRKRILDLAIFCKI